MSVGKLFHVIHVSEALGPLDAWYDRVFGAHHGMMDGHYLPREERMGSLLVVADAVIETAAPADRPAARTAPIGRFFSRFGRHWHSLAWYCDDVAEMWDRLTEAGIRVFLPGRVTGRRPDHGDIYTHPRDTFTQLEFYEPSPREGGPHGPGRFADPRFESGWPARWAAGPNPLGIEALSHATVVVPDLGKAAAVYVDAVGGTLLHEKTSAETGTRSIFVQIGAELIVELAMPVAMPVAVPVAVPPAGARDAAAGGAAALARRDLEANGPACHALTFVVSELDRAADHLRRSGVGLLWHGTEALMTDPAHTFGAPFRFTTRRIPGGPPG